MDDLIAIMKKLLPDDSHRQSKDVRSRMEKYFAWAIETGHTLDSPGLEEYQNFLRYQMGYAPNSVRAHITTIRGFIISILKTGALQDVLYTRGDPAISLNQRKITVDALVGRVHSALNADKPLPSPAASRRNLNLSDMDVNYLFTSFEPRSLRALRDTAIITLMAVTGTRESEICALQVQDIYHRLDGKMAVYIRGKVESEARLVPYRDGEWVIQILKIWIEQARIMEGALFRGFYKTENLMRDKAISPRTVERILADYPLFQPSGSIVLKPLDLRHICAGHMYRAGLDIEIIRQYMGLKLAQTVWDYVGQTGRQPFAEYTFNMSQLNYWKRG